MSRKILLFILTIALLIELILVIGAFFAPTMLLEKFGLTYNPETAFLANIIGWLCLFVTMVIILAIQQVYQRTDYSTLCYMLGFWWIAIGIGIFIVFKKPDNLFLDTAKGLLLLIFTRLSRTAGIAKQ